MSPFAYLLHDLRMRSGIRQHELAELVGYEQSYLSALERGTKGPPTPEFVQKLVSALALDEQDVHRVWDAVDASQRRVEIPNDAPPSVFLMCQELRKQIERLHPIQIELMLIALKLSSSLKEAAPASIRRPRRRKSNIQEAVM